MLSATSTVRERERDREREREREEEEEEEEEGFTMKHALAPHTITIAHAQRASAAAVHSTKYKYAHRVTCNHQMYVSGK